MTTPPEQPTEWTPLRLAALRLTTAWELGSRTLQKIQKKYPDLTTFLQHKRAQKAIPLTAIQEAGVARANRTNLHKLIALMDAQQIRFLLPGDATFPAVLQKMEDPPFAIFTRGRSINEGLHVAVVGTRRMTDYGKQATQCIAGALARAGITIVSGLAIGADITAHIACTEAGGATIAVLPVGIDDASIAPRMHYRFAQHWLIQGNGSLLSEHPPGTPIHPFHFLLRNRLVAALADAVVVTEADHDSGALVTARLGIESGRDVLAVPGSIFLPSFRGTNALIADGARPCRNAEDVFTVLGFKEATQAAHIAHARQELTGTPEEERLIAELAVPRSVDELSRHTQTPIGSVSATISILELKGRIRCVSPRTYVKT